MQFMPASSPRLFLTLTLSLGLFHNGQAQVFISATKFFEVLKGTIVPCGAKCVVEKYRDLVHVTNTCILSQTGAFSDVQSFVEDNNLDETEFLTYSQIYDAIFREGNSPLCSWYKKWAGCLQRGYGMTCGSVINSALADLLNDLEKTVCSTNPNYVGCIAHPSLIVGSGTGNPDMMDSNDGGKYTSCAEALPFSEPDEPGSDTVYTSENYYEQLFIKDNGQMLFRPLETFTSCIAAAIATVPASEATGCSTASSHVLDALLNLIKYFDFGQTGKDYIKCFGNPALHEAVVLCGNDFEQDLMAIYPGKEDLFGEFNNTMYSGNPRIIGPAYSSLSVCLRRAVDLVCVNELDSRDLMQRVLLPLDQYYDVTPRNDQLNVHCAASSTPAPAEGSRGGITCVMDISAFLLSLLCILMWTMTRFL